jgi:hypothetical protein
LATRVVLDHLFVVVPPLNPAVALLGGACSDGFVRCWTLHPYMSVHAGAGPSPALATLDVVAGEDGACVERASGLDVAPQGENTAVQVVRATAAGRMLVCWAPVDAMVELRATLAAGMVKATIGCKASDQIVRVFECESDPARFRCEFVETSISVSENY